LGAVKTKAPGWTYEMVDGDRKTDGRALPKIPQELERPHEASILIVTVDAKLAAQTSTAACTSSFAHSGKLLYLTSILDFACRLLAGARCSGLVRVVVPA